MDEVVISDAVKHAQEGCMNDVHRVYFRAGLLACREYMARFVESESPTIAASIRANWWPSLGADPGPPRLFTFDELTEGEYGTPGFRCKTAEEVGASVEALPIAHIFLEHGGLATGFSAELAQAADTQSDPR